MTSPGRGAVTLSLSLDPGAEPIAGTLATDSERVEFSGWLELAALIEARRGGGPLAQPPPGVTDSAVPLEAPPGS